MQADVTSVVLNESDAYREFAPPVWARDAIACFWVRRGDGSTVRVLPDACADIVWRVGSGAVVAGPDTEAWVSETRPGEIMVGARLLPGAGALGTPLGELRDLRVPVQALGVDPRGELGDALYSDAAADIMVRFALALVAARPPDRAVQAAVGRLLDPGQRVDELAEWLGLSERQLRRRFLATVGYGPKTLQRVLRLRRFMAVAGAPQTAGSEGLAAAAAAAGYADQAHLTRDCRALTGLTPSQLTQASGT